VPLIVEGGLLNITASVLRTTLAMVTLSAGFIGHFRGALTPVGGLIARNYRMTAEAS